MKIALVASGQENLGVEYLMAVCKKNGHDVKFYFDPQTFGGGIFFRINLLRQKLDLSDKVVAKIIEYQPDIVGFSCMTHNYHWSLITAKKIKKIKNIPIIFGGIHPTSVPEMVLSNECIDMVAVGEGEQSLIELLNNMSEGKYSTDIPGIYFKNNSQVIKNEPSSLIEDLNSLPYPDKQLFYDKMPAYQYLYSTMTSRGCPFSCSYCCNDILKNIYKGNYHVRRRSVDNVINELKWAKVNFKIREIYFLDEIFAYNLEWLEEFSARYKKEIGLPFFAYSHFKFATEESIKLLKEAGCCRLMFGMQSTSEYIRREICNRRYSNEEASNAIKLCRKYNIFVSCDHIFGLPFEKEDSWANAVEFYRDATPNIIWTYFLTYYPGTSIIEKGKKAGLIKDEDMQQIFEGKQSYYHKGTYIEDKKKMLTYQLLFDLTPLFPKKVHKWITNNKWILKIAPKGYFPHFFLSFLARIIAKDPVFRRIVLAFSKKNIP